MLQLFSCRADGSIFLPSYLHNCFGWNSCFHLTHRGIVTWRGDIDTGSRRVINLTRSVLLMRWAETVLSGTKKRP